MRRVQVATENLGIRAADLPSRITVSQVYADGSRVVLADRVALVHHDLQFLDDESPDATGFDFRVETAAGDVYVI